MINRNNFGLSFCFSFVLNSALFAYDEISITADNLQSMLADDCAVPLAKTIYDHDEKLFQECVSSITSLYAQRAIDDIPERVLNWGSQGRGDALAWQFKDERCNQFFVSMMETIVAEQPPIKMTPHDLFHGHIIEYATIKDEKAIAVVFHAREYPADLEIVKNYYQKDSELFTSIDQAFSKRNFIFLSHLHNEHQGELQPTGARYDLYLLANDGACHKFFGDEGYTLSEDAIAQGLRSGHLIGDVNIFLSDLLPRLQYQFYPGLSWSTAEFLLDLEEVDSGMSVSERLDVNEYLRYFVEGYKSPYLVYFKTDDAK